MGNILAGLALALLGVILFQVANTFFFYPAKTDINSGRVYYILKTLALILWGAGLIFIVLGYM
jgi:hypothetical protein